jgi:predicted alpha/beta-fold hydrolase
MPVVPSSFDPPFLLRNGHVQTIAGAIRPRRIGLTYERERLELSDGDFLDLDWAHDGRSRVAILSHGLEGSSADTTTRGLAEALNAAGWDALAWNFRGCSDEPNRLLRFYHSGETRDLAAVVEHAAARYERVAIIGFSLGGNMALKYLGESAPHPAIVAAAAVSAPVDLASSARALDRRWANRIYLRRFMTRLIAKVEAKALRFPREIDVADVRRINSFAEFDDRYTARIHGFRDATDYWTQSSARQYLPRLTVPTLLLNALNDPFLTSESFPTREARENPLLFLETPRSGGHLGFLDARGSWLDRRIPEFLASCDPSNRP